MKPRVGVNLLWLIPEDAAGAEEYAVRVLRAMLEFASGTLDVVLLVNRRFADAHPDLAAGFETTVAPIEGGSRAVRIATESTWLRAKSEGMHLVHHTNNLIPWVSSLPVVLTVHDLRPLEHPETLSRWQGAYLRARFDPSVRRATMITTPSRFVRGTVIERFGVEPDRVRVVSAPVLPASVHDRVDPRPGPPYFVYPATTAPHKNHRMLLEAFARVIARRPDARMVLTGPTGAAESSIRAVTARLGLLDHVRRLGRVAPDRLDDLYRGAVALTYPSTYEGFGLPVAEAMARGCPVIAADVTALPEVVEDAGVLLDPRDAEAWAGAMLELLSDEDARTRLSELGRRRVAAWSPRATVRDQLDVYRLAVDGR